MTKADHCCTAALCRAHPSLPANCRPDRLTMSGAVTMKSVVSAVKTAVCGRRSAHRAAVASLAAAGKRLPGALSGRALLAYRVGALRGAAVTCTSSVEDIMEVELKVEGMVCDGCSSRVAEALQKLPGVKKVDVDLEKGIATVQVEAASQIDAFNTMPQMVDTITGLGFQAEPHFGEAEV